jgi:5'-3' exonuclease
MKPTYLLFLLSCLVLTSSYLTSVHAVTEAELEALEKQIEQQEVDEKKKAEEEAKKIAEENRKLKAEKKRLAEEKMKRKAEENKLLAEQEKQRLEEEQIRLEEEKRKLEETQLAELERRRKEEENITKKILMTPVILVVSGTYGVNCGAPHGNVTQHLSDACNDRKRCEYIVDYKVIGDPVWGCGKTYEAEWKCSENGQVFRTVVQPEAGYRKKAVLFCNDESAK